MPRVRRPNEDEDLQPGQYFAYGTDPNTGRVGRDFVSNIPGARLEGVGVGSGPLPQRSIRAGRFAQEGPTSPGVMRPTMTADQIDTEIGKPVPSLTAFQQATLNRFNNVPARPTAAGQAMLGRARLERGAFTVEGRQAAREAPARAVAAAGVAQKRLDDAIALKQAGPSVTAAAAERIASVRTMSAERIAAENNKTKMLVEDRLDTRQTKELTSKETIAEDKLKADMAGLRAQGLVVLGEDGKPTPEYQQARVDSLVRLQEAAQAKGDVEESQIYTKALLENISALIGAYATGQLGGADKGADMVLQSIELSRKYLQQPQGEQAAAPTATPTTAQPQAQPAKPPMSDKQRQTDAQALSGLYTMKQLKAAQEKAEASGDQERAKVMELALLYERKNQSQAVNGE